MSLKLQITGIFKVKASILFSAKMRRPRSRFRCKPTLGIIKLQISQALLV